MFFYVTLYDSVMNFQTVYGYVWIWYQHKVIRWKSYVSNSSLPTVYSSKIAEVRLVGKKWHQSDLMQVLKFPCPKAFEKCKTFVSIFCYEL
jgi:hypothetical protein